MSDDTPRATVDKLLDAEFSGPQPQNEGNEVILRQFMQLYMPSAKAKERQVEKWKKNIAIDENRHWDGVEGWSPDRSKITANLAKSFKRSTKAALTDNRPTIFVQPRDEKDEPLAHDLEQAIYFVFDQCNFEIKFPKTVDTSCTLGPGFLKMYWNPFTQTGQEKGAIEIGHVMGTDLYPDPEVSDWDAIRYITHVRDLHFDWLLENYPDDKYPGLVESIPSGGWDLPLHASRLLTGHGADGFVPIAGTSGNAYMQGFQRSGEKLWGSDKRATVAELLVREDQKRIRKVVIANGTVLENEPFGVLRPDGSMAYFKEFPYVLFPFEPTERSLWPEGLYDGMEGLQLLVNKCLSIILDHMLWTAHQPLVVDNEAMANDVKIDNHPGAIIRKSGQGNVTRLAAAAMPNEAFRLAEIVQQMMELQSGHVEILQGRNPKGVEAGKALELLQEQANSRIRQTARYFEKSLEQLAELTIDFIGLYWGEPRMVRMVGQNGKMIYRYLNGSMFRGHEFDVSIKAGSTLPFSRAQRRKEMLEMHDHGIFGAPGSALASAVVLRGSDVPGADEIIQGHEAQEQQMMQMQAQQQAAQQQQQQGQGGQPQAPPMQPPPPPPTPASMA